MAADVSTIVGIVLMAIGKKYEKNTKFDKDFYHISVEKTKLFLKSMVSIS